MAVSTRLIRHRIKSVGNTKKITKAMELVSASKMRRAVNAVLSSRSYAGLAWETLTALSKLSNPFLHPLLARREPVKKILVVLVTSDRGLCGGFNAQIIKQVLGFRSQVSDLACDFITVGKKAQDAVRRLKWNVAATFTNLSAAPSATDIQPIAALAVNDFKSGVYDRVYLAFTDFISSLKQSPRFKQLLPFVKVEGLGEAEMGKGQAPLQDIAKVGPEESRFNPEENLKYHYEYVFEPSPAEVLNILLPRLIEVQIYQAVLESSASEHSARMVAMKNATEAAVDMIDDLTFTFNQARQSVITREIAEISAGKAALE